MSLIWKPNGTLNVSTAATDLPESSVNGSSVFSEAFQRLKNMRFDRVGRVKTRPGSSNASSGTLRGIANLIIEQGGDRYAFSNGAVHKNETEIVSGLSSGQWSGIKYNAFNETTEQIFALNGSERRRIMGTSVEKWGIAAPGDVPTLAVGSSTGLTGDYKARYTYARKSGATVIAESNMSVEPPATTLSDESLSITVTTPSDPQVTHIRIYRTLANGSAYFHDRDITVGTTSIDTSTADTSLGSQPPTNHDRPPAGTVVAGPFYNGICFIAKGNLLYWCLPRRPEYWPLTQFIEVGPPHFPMKTIIDYNGMAYALTKQKLWFIQGAGTGSFNPLPLNSLTGAPNLFGAVGIEGHGIFHIGPDGIYLFAGGRDRKITQDNFEPLFRGEAKNGMPGMSASDISNAWLLHYENRLYFHYGAGNALVLNLDNNRAGYYQWDTTMSAPVVDETNDQLLAGTATKKVRILEDLDSDDDQGTDISWEAESKDYTLQTRRHFGRWAKYDVEGTATAEIIYDGSVQQTHALSVSRQTKRRLIKTGNARRCSIRLSGTGTATFYAAEME